jgi:DNA polymerase/3'-5' exonuclease PolX
MFIREAQAIANRLVAQISPFCRRVEIAGSIRRGCQVVKDIELVVVPEWAEGERPASALFDLGEATPRVNLLHVWARSAGVHNCRWIKTGTSEVVDWVPKAEGKYWRALVGEEIKLDLFLTTPEQWGLIFLIRTGSAEFSQAVMAYAKYYTRFHVERGTLCYRNGLQLTTPTEQDVFDSLGLDFVEPRERTGFAAVRKGGQPAFPEGDRAGLMSRVSAMS